jgi:prepilin-type N-terminal cleavage/methylation domain-containing protein
MNKKGTILNSFSGVSLIELIIVVAIILIVGGASAVFGANFLNSNNLEIKTTEVVFVLRNAQLNALSSKKDSRWGVKTNASDIILFKGDSFAERDATYDEVYDVPRSISITESEVVFEKLTGVPNGSAEIVVSSQNGEAYVLEVNEVGIVNLN